MGECECWRCGGPKPDDRYGWCAECRAWATVNNHARRDRIALAVRDAVAVARHCMEERHRKRERQRRAHAAQNSRETSEGNLDAPASH